jgi:hypothetical protein
MRKNNIILLTLFIIASGYLAKAQDMKKLELHIHAQTLYTPEDEDYPKSRDAFYGLPSVQLLYNFNKHINAGLFYNRSVVSATSVSTNAYNNIDAVSSVYQSYGAMVKIGTNRIRRFCFYAMFQGSSVQMADEFNVEDVDNGQFRVSSSGFAYAGGLGLSLKATRGFNITLFEVNYISFPGELNYMTQKPFYGLSAEMGLVVLFLRQK